MQAAVLWGLIAAVVLALGAALLRQWQLLRAARGHARALERQLAHASGFALVGQLGATTVQEIGQSLAAVGARIATLQRLAARSDAGPALQPVLEALDGEGLRAQEMVQRLLALLRRAGEGREWFDLHDMLRDAVQLLQPEARRRGMELILQPGPARPGLVAERAQLELVVLQLLANAMDAMARTQPAHRRVLVSTHDDGARVEIRVSDRGEGFGARRPETLFTPYYTTREGHMGLGLSVARSIVEAHEGRIEARRRAGGGAVFTVSLPRAAAAPEAASAARPSSSFAASCVVQP